MNEKFETLLKEKAEGVRFSADEKSQMKNRLHSFMRMYPVRNAEPRRQDMQESKKNIIANLAFFRLKYMTAFALAILLFVSGGMTYAAEGSLPGDLLYPVKLHVSEPVRQYLSFSTESKAQLEAELAKKRLAEAEEMAANGTLDSTVAADLEANFKAHADRAGSYVRELSANGNADAAATISTNLETSLLGHGKILDTLGVANVELYDELKGIGESVHAQVNAAADVRSKIEAEAAQQLGARADAAAHAKIKLAENAVASARAILDKMKSSLSAETAAKAEGQLQAAETDIAQAKAHIAAKAYTDAFTLLQHSLRTAESLKLFLNVQSHLKLNMDIGTIHISIGAAGEGSATSSGSTSGATSTGAQGGVNITVPGGSSSVDVKINTDTKAGSSSINSGSNTQIKIGL